MKIIEHDGYIDYEIEFIELSDYYDYDLEIKDVAVEKSTTEKLSEAELTFVDLLQQARQQHRTKENKTSGSMTSSKTEERNGVKR